MFDYVIVGAGSAGCVLAARLTEDAGCRVLLIEAGAAERPLACQVPALWGSVFNSEIDWGFYTIEQPGCLNRRIFWPRGRLLGGSGAINAMVYMRGRASDYDAWANGGGSGWGWDEVLPVFIAAECNRRFGQDRFHGAAGPLVVSDPAYVDPAERAFIAAAIATGLPPNRDFNGRTQMGVGLVQATIADGVRCGPYEAYLRPALDRPNLTVLTDATATRIVIENSRAVGVEYLRQGQAQRALAASEVILAAGAIGSPHLLMLSGVGPPDKLRSAGVAVVHDLPGVGRNLQDHALAGITFHSIGDMALGGLTSAQLAALTERWQRDHGGPMASNWASAVAHVASNPALPEPDLQIYGIPSSRRDANRYVDPHSGMSLYAVLLRPQSRGEIRLASPDPLRPPQIDPRYFSDAGGRDVTAMVSAMRICRAIANKSPLADLLAAEIAPSAGCDSNGDLEQFIRAQSGTLFHPVGTCRLGNDDEAVVDPRLKVRGLDGLRVIDASVMPLITSGNTNAPTMMIAEREAAFLRAAA